ncbi:MAG: hypothetical protein ABIT04_09130 [Novosphingobium sp.]
MGQPPLAGCIALKRTRRAALGRRSLKHRRWSTGNFVPPPSFRAGSPSAAHCNHEHEQAFIGSARVGGLSLRSTLGYRRAFRQRGLRH